MRVVQMNAFSSPPKKGNDIIGREENIVPENKTERVSSYNIKKLLNGFKTDDYILLGIITVLMLEGCDDYILLAALGYLFIMGIMQAV